MKRLVLATHLFCFLAIGPALAQSGLSDSEVRRFISTIEKLSELPDLKEDHVAEPMMSDPDEIADALAAPFTNSLDAMRADEQFDSAMRIIKSEGFGNEREWAQVGDRVFRAFMAIKMDEVNQEMEEGMTEAMKNLDEMEMPEEMKEKMRDALKTAQRVKEEADDVPATDRRVVERHLEELEDALDG